MKQGDRLAPDQRRAIAWALDLIREASAAAATVEGDLGTELDYWILDGLIQLGRWAERER